MMMASLEADGVSGGMLPSIEIGDGTIGMVPPSPSTITENKKKGKRRGRKSKKK